ncbi:hypothetical protein O6P43_020275 [Quillaja saponaria]|uniref:Uncharacterized protein n=1 Tax=Quillaja saponaria TaxID=32244 RepID=A0AAD7LKP2_QUISA|nr:hypothetical protein O6P43_020275 [Quillaja saponaria]
MISTKTVTYTSLKDILPKVEKKGLFNKLKEKLLCGGDAIGEFGCFEWLSDVVLKNFKNVVIGAWERKGIENAEGEEEEEQT